MGLYNVVVGDDFEISAVEVEDVEDVCELSKIAERRRHQSVQQRLTYLILVAIIVALLIATAIGIHDGTLNEVGLVWSAAALPLGYVLKAYFDKPAVTLGSKGGHGKVK